MLIPSHYEQNLGFYTSLSRRVNANSQLFSTRPTVMSKLIKKGEC